MPRDVTGGALLGAITQRLRRYQRDPDASPPAEASGGGSSGDGEATGIATGGATAAADADAAATASSSSSGGGVRGRSDQWKLYYSSMKVNALGHESHGAEVVCDEEACSFPSVPGGGYGGSYGGYGASSSYGYG